MIKDPRTNVQWRMLQLESNSLIRTYSRIALGDRLPLVLDFITSPERFAEFVRAEAEALKKYSYVLINSDFPHEDKRVIGGITLALEGAGVKKSNIVIYGRGPRKSIRDLEYQDMPTIHLIEELRRRLMKY
jgi:hypothetical protein